jgi:tRNA(Ile)-lysidine synthetase-like protein
MNISTLGDRIVNQYDLGQSKMVVAVSTGVDSTVLINALVATKQLTHDQLIVAHVNHQLRDQSDEEERWLKNWCQNQAIQFVVTHWAKADHPTTGIEAAARQFRYDFFKQVMLDYHAEVLLTAHNADEQAESFVMQLMRGGWLNQLNGIPEQRSFAGGRLIRPFLKTAKQTLIEIAQTQGLQWFEDVTNQSHAFLRNRVRNEILPAFQKENPKAMEHIGQFQTQLSEQTALIDEIVQSKLNQLGEQPPYDLKRFKSESIQWQKQLLLKMIANADSTIAVSQNQLEELITFVNQTHRAQSSINLGNQSNLEITYNQLQINKKITVKGEQVKKRVLTLNTWLNLNGPAQLRISDQKTSELADETMILSANQFKQPLFFRKVLPSDRLRLKDGGFKTVRRELIDQKVPNAKRSQYFSIIDAEGTVLWVPGLRKAWLQAPFLKNNQPYTIEFRTGGRLNGQ